MMKFKCDVNMTEIELKLGELKKQAPKVLSDAVNDTAKDAKRLLAKTAREQYTVASSKFQKAMKLKRANPSKPVAVIRATGKQMEVIEFKTNPKKRIDGSKDSVNTKIIKNNGMKALTKKGADHHGNDLKSFIVQYASGHVSVASRVPGEQTTKNVKGYGGKYYRVKVDKIRSIPAVSIPQMLRNKQRVYGVVRPVIQEKLQNNVNRRIRKVLRK